MNVNIGLEDATEAIIEDVQLFDYALFPEDIAELSTKKSPLEGGQGGVSHTFVKSPLEGGQGGVLPGSAGVSPASDDGPVLLGDGDGPVITTITYYYINGQRVAQAKDGVFTWIHADHLSSATRITDVNGLEVRRLAYAAFGEEAENQDTGDDPKYTYTGKEQDSSGLYYYGARYYDPALSRFITADSVYDAGPQGLNRYSYALNNPIIYRDPTGNFVSGPDDSQDPDDYGCITGSQDQFADGTAVVHDGNFYDTSDIIPPSDMTLKEFDDVGPDVFPADPRIYKPHKLKSNEQYHQELAERERMRLRQGAMETLAIEGKVGDPNYFSLLKKEMERQRFAQQFAVAMAGGIVSAWAARNMYSASLAASKESSGTAHNAANAQKLRQQLTSEEQVSELLSGKGEPIMGAGTNRPLREASRLASEYGGNPADWAKVVSSNKHHATGYNQETHAYQNMRTGQVVEIKTKIEGH